MGAYKVPVRVENVNGSYSWLGYCLKCPQHRVIGSLDMVKRANLEHVVSFHWELRAAAWEAEAQRRRRAVA